MYGLDISIIKSLNMENLIEEKIKQEEDDVQQMIKADPYAGKDYEQLRQEFAFKPTESTVAVNRLRGACMKYEN